MERSLKSGDDGEDDNDIWGFLHAFQDVYSSVRVHLETHYRATSIVEPRAPLRQFASKGS